MSIRNALERSWIKPNGLTLALKPLSLVYQSVFNLRAKAYQAGLLSCYRAPVPVLVIGNLSVGGTGKTPLVIHVVELLKQNGFTPGVISRGYGGEAPAYPLQVTSSTAVKHSGDEPALIVGRTNVDMFVGADRKASIEALLQANPKINIIVSDDGLQHLALERDIEICLLDATSPQTNQSLLPAGPLREPLARLKTVDIVVQHGLAEDDAGQFSMNLSPRKPRPVSSLRDNSGTVDGRSGDDVDESSNDLEPEFDSQAKFHAVAGIGNPQRFFTTCSQLGYRFSEHAFADHHAFSKSDLDFGDTQVLMTEKDAVKCQDFADARHWFLPVDATLSPEFNATLLEKIASLTDK